MVGRILCFRSLTANKSFTLIKMSWLLFHPDCMSLGRSCYHCGEFKEWADFHVLRHGRGGRMSICAPCKNEQRRIVRRLREIHPVPIACEGCGEIGGKLQLDHDHTNGQFRAYLCCPCNLAVRRGRWARWARTRNFVGPEYFRNEVRSLRLWLSKFSA